MRGSWIWSVGVPTLRAAWWAMRAVRRARDQFATRGLVDVQVPAPPSLPSHAERGVVGALRRLKTTCLERAAVRQAWYAAHGSPRDLIIGVTPPADGFRAHAWLDGDDPCHAEEFHELLRRSA